MNGDRRRTPGSSTERVLFGHVQLAGPAVCGYVLDPEREGEALVVELLVDGLPCEVARAGLYDATLADEGARNAYHGFRFALDGDTLERAEMVEVRLANDGTPIGEAIPMAPWRALASDTTLPAGWLAWQGGLTFGGWLAPSVGSTATLKALVDENQVAEARPQGWVTIEQGGAPLSVPAFELRLPARFADGRAHRLEVVTDAGQVLSPGPVAFVAFEDGLAAFLEGHADVAAEQVRGTLFDRLIPQSLPFEALPVWARRFAPPPGEALARPVAVVLLGDARLQTSLDSLQEQRDPWIAGVLACPPDRPVFDPADLVAFLEAEAQDCEIVVLAESGTLFLPGALQRLAHALLAGGSRADCAYGDLLLLREDGRLLPLALPAFDRERMLEQGYAAPLFALTRRAALTAARGGADSFYALVQGAAGGLSGRAAAPPLHVPAFVGRVGPPALPRAGAALLEAVRRRCEEEGVQGAVEPVRGAALAFPAVRVRRRPPRGLLSVIVPVRNGAADLDRCLAALREQEGGENLELIVVDNDSASADLEGRLAAAAGEGVQVVRMRGPRNLARAVNCGAAVAAGASLLILDPRVALGAPDTLLELQGRLAAPDVGAAGGLLTWPSGAVWDGGQVLSFRNGASRAFVGLPPEEAAYADMLLAAREVSALSPALLMVARDVFEAAGGMDEVLFPLFFPAQAFCLSIAGLGRRCIFTPHARAVWHGPGDDEPRGAEAQARHARELAQLRLRWPLLLANDPAYSPLLNLDGQLYGGLAWPPRDMGARQPAHARVPRAKGANTVSAAPEPARRRSSGDEP